MGKKYNKPPLVEAVCEFRFSQDTAWDWAIPGLVYEKLRDDFPVRKQTRQVGFGLSTSQDTFEQQVHTANIVQFVRKDETALIQVGANLLSVNHLKPYSTWTDFKPLIEKGFTVYKDEAQPDKLVRIGLRYINRIEISENPVDLEDYFEFYPHVPTGCQHLNNFIVGVEKEFKSGRDLEKIVLTQAETHSSNQVAMTLDIDYHLAKPELVVLESAMDWVEFAHSNLEKSFEACIRDNLRELFEKV